MPLIRPQTGYKYIYIYIYNIVYNDCGHHQMAMFHACTVNLSLATVTSWSWFNRSIQGLTYFCEPSVWMLFNDILICYIMKIIKMCYYQYISVMNWNKVNMWICRVSSFSVWTDIELSYYYKQIHWSLRACNSEDGISTKEPSRKASQIQEPPNFPDEM